MPANPLCLHISFLYEDQTADIAWGETPGDVEYELDFWCDETFEEASVGVEWQYLCDTGNRWDDIHPALATWTQFHQLPARGLSWQKANLDGLTWNQLSGQINHWTELGDIPIAFTTFRGKGSSVVAPELGKTWNEMSDTGKSWTDLLIPEYSWNAITRLPVQGPVMGQLLCPAYGLERMDPHPTKLG